jgi:hypothetical protein
MTESKDTAAVPETATAPPAYGAATPVPAPPAPGAPVYAGAPGTAPIGKIRSTGTCILLTIVTLGFYTWYWYYKTHDEMKQHSGTGLGGPVALILAMFVSIAMPFVTSNEVGGLYERRGQAKPVSAGTGLWFLLLGWLLFIGAFVWFVKTNSALNDYWRSLGATEG